MLDAILPEMLSSHPEVWVVTGTGHHVAKGSHQRAGGVLFSIVDDYLAHTLMPALAAQQQRVQYLYHQARDKAGHHGAFLVRRRPAGGSQWQ